MSKHLDRKLLKVNNRSNIKQVFQYVEPTLKSIANPSIVTWAGPGKGIEGESTNSSSTNDGQIIRRNSRPI